MINFRFGGHIFTYPFALLAFLAGIQIVVGLGMGLSGFAVTPYLRAGSAILVFFFLALYVIRNRFVVSFCYISGYGFLYFLFGLSAIAYFIIGLFYGNNVFYLITDTSYLVLSLMLYSYGLKSAKMKSSIESKLLLMVLILCVVNATLPVLGYKPSGDFLVVWLAFFFAFLVKGQWSRVALILLVIAINFVNLNRALFLSFFVLAFFVFVFGKSKNKVSHILALVLIFVFLVVSYNFFSTTISGSVLDRRINETVQVLSNEDGMDSLPIALAQRFYEGELVFQEFDRRGDSWLHYVFGLGYGLTLDMSQSEDSSVTDSQLAGASNTHNIHFMHFAVLARGGVIGVLLLVLFFLKSISRLKKVIRREDKLMFMVSDFFILGMLVFSIPASSFYFTSFLLPYFAGASDARHRENI